MPSGRFIILGKRASGESDLVIDVLSKQGEKLSLWANNALKSRKRFAGGALDPLNFVELHFTQSQKGYLNLKESRILYGFPELRKDYSRLQMAFQFLIWVSKGAKEGLVDNQVMFDLLGNGLRALETTKTPYILKLHFEIKLLYYLGFLEVTDDLEEFILRPLGEHSKIHLEQDEYQFLADHMNKQMKSIDLG
ncbi:MAG: DNA repair protein RecO [Bdellovibrionales bacterium]|nr:DNA repair protein RecO [Bdellovibrionales bacterium]